MNYLLKSNLFSLILILSFTFSSVAQNTVPQAQPPVVSPFGNLFNTGIGQFNQGADTTNNTASTPKADTDTSGSTLKKKVENMELENKLILLQKEKALLEKELQELLNKGVRTDQDSKNIELKKQNLELLLQKERILLQKELEKYTDFRKGLPQSGIIGMNHLRNPNLNLFEKMNNTNPSENYILGSGDQIQVDIWGRAGFSGNYTVDANGFIQIPKMQKIYVRNKTLSETRVLVKSRFERLVDLRGSNFSLSVSNVRTIIVQIAGEVYNPGTYAFSAVNSLYNILQITGGPNNNGSLRTIYVQRNGSTIDSFDLYDYIFNGNENGNLFLQNNDKIFIPLSKKIVSINGPVRRGGTFELKENENLNDLLKLAGGLKNNAYLKEVLVKRTLPNSLPEAITINLDSLVNNKTSFDLFYGDKIFIKSIGGRYENIISLDAGVKRPGEYEIKKGDRLSDLILRAGGLNEEIYDQTAYMVRTYEDLSQEYLPFNPRYILENQNESSNYLIQERDQIQFYTKAQFLEQDYVKSSGAFKFPSRFPFLPGLTVNKIITYSGGITEKALSERIYLIRNPYGLKREILSLELDSNGFVRQDVKLMPDDEIISYVRLNSWQNFGISIAGEVEKPTNFPYSIGITLYDALIISGGLTKTAEPKKVEIIRSYVYDEKSNSLIALDKKRVIEQPLSRLIEENKIFDTFQLQPLDQIYIRNQYVDDPGKVRIVGEVKYPGVYAISSSGEKLTDLIIRAGGFTDYASKDALNLQRQYDSVETPVRVILDWQKASNRKGSKFNYLLVDGDKITVPKQNSTVLIQGELNSLKNQTQIATYYKRKRAKYYINSFAGGFTKNISRKDVTVEYVDGSIKKTKNYLIFKVYPKVKKGAVINVPAKEEKKKKGKRFNLQNAVTQVLTTTTSVLTLLALFNIATGN